MLARREPALTGGYEEQAGQHDEDRTKYSYPIART